MLFVHTLTYLLTTLGSRNKNVPDLFWILVKDPIGLTDSLRKTGAMTLPGIDKVMISSSEDWELNQLLQEKHTQRLSTFKLIEFCCIDVSAYQYNKFMSIFRTLQCFVCCRILLSSRKLETPHRHAMTRQALKTLGARHLHRLQSLSPLATYEISDRHNNLKYMTTHLLEVQITKKALFT